MKLNREQIIKAFSHCNGEFGGVCGGCPLRGDRYCAEHLRENILSLINELTQENEQLSESYDHLEKTKDELLAERSRLIEENERLKSTTGVTKLIAKPMDEEEQKRLLAELKNAPIQILTDNSQTKADTVMEMQERLTRFFANDDNLKYNEVDAEYVNEQIDQIAKEMLEGEK